MSTPTSSSSSALPSRTSTPTHFTASSTFTTPSTTLEDELKTQTVGLVNLRDFQKRRVELAEQRDREAAESTVAGRSGVGAGSAASSSREASVGAGAEGPRKKKRKGNVIGRGKLSFAGDEDEESEGSGIVGVKKMKMKGDVKSRSTSTEVDEADGSETSTSTPPPPIERKRKANPLLKAPPPKALTKSTLLREAQERELLRREFLQLQEKIKNEDITIPFVFYDGTNVPPPNNEPVTIKKGSPVWLFLERARRVSGRREWLRVSVDDLLLVRGDLIIPHHYEFYYFIANRTVGPNGILFDYPSPLDPNNNANDSNNPSNEEEKSSGDASRDKTAADSNKTEGTKQQARRQLGHQNGREDPTLTKVVDRRWYERNKHIFPASIWTEYDPNADYKGMVRRDLGGNAFFFG
ncbi:XAP5-domain-containing protein [Ascodesmis nigricans]|uniref:XAP5-domain-containing protein n=1 Tax=Ascodesmis nigricans TaxID=341454 RepID=A0A4S2N4S2_9PEZI|nr:XAP5-domain-containing protein [Ascodesmis nigricans]